MQPTEDDGTVAGEGHYRTVELPRLKRLPAAAQTPDLQALLRCEDLVAEAQQLCKVRARQPDQEDCGWCARSLLAGGQQPPDSRTSTLAPHAPRRAPAAVQGWRSWHPDGSGDTPLRLLATVLAAQDAGKDLF